MELEKHLQEERAVGGLREAFRAVLKLPGLQVWGPVLSELFQDHLNARPQLEARIVHVIEQRESTGWPRESIPVLRKQIMTRISSGLKCQGRSYEERGPSTICDLDGDVMVAWAKVAYDPGTLIQDWFWEGSPAGVKYQLDIG